MQNKFKSQIIFRKKKSMNEQINLYINGRVKILQEIKLQKINNLQTNIFNKNMERNIEYETIQIGIKKYFQINGLNKLICLSMYQSCYLMIKLINKMLEQQCTQLHQFYSMELKQHQLLSLNLDNPKVDYLLEKLLIFIIIIIIILLSCLIFFYPTQFLRLITTKVKCQVTLSFYQNKFIIL
ncbi:hypothetical protein ABPG74_002426 [Tetrahymena malaccensis]